MTRPSRPIRETFKLPLAAASAGSKVQTHKAAAEQGRPVHPDTFRAGKTVLIALCQGLHHCLAPTAKT